MAKTSDNIQIKIKMPNPSQELPASFKTLNEDLKDIGVLCIFKIKIVSQNLNHGCIKDQWPYTNQDQDVKRQSGTSSLLQNMDVLSNFKIKRGDQNLGHGCIKDQWPCQNQDQDANPQSGTCSILKRPKPALEGHGCSLHYQIQFRQSIFESLLYQWPVTISESKWRC